MNSSDHDAPSTRPYLIRALHEWCVDQGFSPFLAVHVDDSVQVPMEFVKNGEIVLNVSWDATNGLRLGNEFIEFKARFGGVPRDIVVPVTHVLAIYARENGQGMAFPPPAVIQPPVSPGQAHRLGGDDDGPRTAASSPARTLRAVPVEPADGTATPNSHTSPDDPDPTTPLGGAGRPRLTRVK